MLPWFFKEQKEPKSCDSMLLQRERNLIDKMVRCDRKLPVEAWKALKKARMAKPPLVVRQEQRHRSSIGHASLGLSLPERVRKPRFGFSFVDHALASASWKSGRPA